MKNFELMNEEFDPLSLKDEDIEVDDVILSSSTTVDIAESVESGVKDTLVTGYRIQIIQTTDAEEAKSVQKDAILRFNEDVYRLFDPPFYKVRVGNYLNWYDAEKVQKLAIQKGYRDAWVVRTKVNLKKASRWIDDL
ncbi:MAG TPA: SPOR domain-containing protein [bacterium]